MKILLAIDGSEHSEAAVDEVARQRFPAASTVRIISVVEPPYFPGTFSAEGMDQSSYLGIETSARDRARAAVEGAAARLRANEASQQFNVTTDVLSGPPKRMVLDDAEGYGADLIVVGSHGHGVLGRFLLGSVAQAVALHATCSVEIVRGRNVQTATRKETSR